ncbi:TolC family outer membrane protein [Sneathiella marina]|uniref:TolC family outer membrane protein n=1 Tax=Sneathiella marina TaxID=2950108 RepID=A0ABY4VYU4_9PROT|nr:TolC family outer membrane protein [Sneathiella marina]USG59904.1 TolC family outer membrane protein [Sneathiella marina]
MNKMALTVASVIAVILPLSGVSAETLNEALAATYQNNPTLQAQRASVRGVDEDVSQALSGWRPEVIATANASAQHSNTNITNNPGGSKDTTPTQAALTVSQPVYTGGITTATTKSAEASVLAARESLLSTEQTIFQQAVSAYVNVLSDTAVVELNNNNTTVLRRQLEAAQDRFEVGEITRTDVAQAEARLADSISNLIQSEGNLRSTRANFERIVGKAPEDLVIPVIPTDFPESEDAALITALENHPDIKTAKFNEESSRHNIRATSGQLLPVISVDGTLAHGNEVSGSGSWANTASIGAFLTVPLYQSGSVYSQVRQARQINSQRMQEIEEAVRLIRESVVQSWEQLETARSRIGSNQEAVRANTIALEGVEQEAQVGSRTTLDVLNAEQELLDSKVNLVLAQRDQYVAVYNVVASIGKLNARDLQLNVDYYDPAANYDRVRGKWVGTDGGLD